MRKMLATEMWQAYIYNGWEDLSFGWTCFELYSIIVNPLLTGTS